MDKRIFTAKSNLLHHGKTIPPGGKLVLDLDDKDDGDCFDQLDAVGAIDDGVEATEEALADLEAETNPRKAARRAKPVATEKPAAPEA